MRAIDCNTDEAKKIIEAQRDALEVNVNPLSSELWRIRLNDCIAIAYNGKVLPQGKNPQRIADLLAQLQQPDLFATENSEETAWH